jgi:hypothetical protein
MSTKKGTMYSCKKCGREFKEERYLQQHRKRKTPCSKNRKCNKCGKKFTRERDLQNHLKRKTPCTIEEIPVITGDNLENRCHMCGKTYANSSNLRRHMDSCKVKDNPNVIMALIEQNKELMERLMTQQNQPVTVNNVTVNQVQQNLYVNVTICSFGKEDLSRLDTSKVMQLLKGQVKDFMPRMIEHVHANPDYPEFHNVFYDPERQKAIVFAPISDTEMSWRACDFKEISQQITNKIRSHMRPGESPYFDMAMQNKDTETSNKIIEISQEMCFIGDEDLEKHKSSLTKVTKNEGFLEQVSVIE